MLYIILGLGIVSLVGKLILSVSVGTLLVMLPLHHLQLLPTLPGYFLLDPV